MFRVVVGDEEIDIPRDFCMELHGFGEEIFSMLAGTPFIIRRDNVRPEDVRAFITFWELYKRSGGYITGEMHALVNNNLLGLSCLSGVLCFEPLYQICIRLNAQRMQRMSSYRIARELGVEPSGFANIL